MRLWGTVLALTILLALPFVFWGDAFDAAFSPERMREVFDSWGSWAWLAGIALITSDIILPMPATVVMTGLGSVYGPFLGGVIAAVGSFTAGSVAYGACRLFGRGAARRIVGDDELRRGEELFSRIGGWAVALSRWLPLLPEVVACVAGLVKMPAGRFFASLACGSVPLGFTFAFLGRFSAKSPGLTLALSAVLPAILWVVVGRVLSRLSSEAQAVDEDVVD
jgi:uncharacterized membrane protein YdjX (TVP38/TMEM64 family)